MGPKTSKASHLSQSRTSIPAWGTETFILAERPHLEEMHVAPEQQELCKVESLMGELVILFEEFFIDLYVLILSIAGGFHEWSLSDADKGCLFVKKIYANI